MRAMAKRALSARSFSEFEGSAGDAGLERGGAPSRRRTCHAFAGQVRQNFPLCAQAEACKLVSGRIERATARARSAHDVHASRPRRHAWTIHAVLRAA
jgi:hypothetical protein